MRMWNEKEMIIHIYEREGKKKRSKVRIESANGMQHKIYWNVDERQMYLMLFESTHLLMRNKYILYSFGSNDRWSSCEQRSWKYFFNFESIIFQWIAFTSHKCYIFASHAWQHSARCATLNYYWFNNIEHCEHVNQVKRKNVGPASESWYSQYKIFVRRPYLCSFLSFHWC